MAEAEGRLVGHVLPTRLEVVAEDRSAATVLGVAPLSVLPGLQNRGIGSALLREAHRRAVRAGFGAALLVGTLCLPVPSNATNLVTLPALFGLFAAAYTVYGVLNLFTTRQDAPAWEYNTVNHALTGGTVIAAGLLAVALVLDIGYQLLVLKAFVPLELAAMGGYVLCMVLELALFRRWRGLTVTAHKAEPEQQSPQALQ